MGERINVEEEHDELPELALRARAPGSWYPAAVSKAIFSNIFSELLRLSLIELSGERPHVEVTVTISNYIDRLQRTAFER